MCKYQTFGLVCSKNERKIRLKGCLLWGAIMQMGLLLQFIVGTDIQMGFNLTKYCYISSFHSEHISSSDNHFQFPRTNWPGRQVCWTEGFQIFKKTVFWESECSQEEFCWFQVSFQAVILWRPEQECSTAEKVLSWVQKAESGPRETELRYQDHHDSQAEEHEVRGRIKARWWGSGQGWRR